MKDEEAGAEFSAACETDSSDLSAAQRDEFTFYVTAMHVACVQVLSRYGVPGFDLRAVLTSRFEELVQQLVLMGLSEEEAAEARPFTTERLGGTVMAKCFAPRGDEERYVIVLPDAMWSDDFPLAERLQVVTHELAHCALMQARGTPRPVLAEDPSTCGEGAAAEIVAEVIDEYRGDMVSDVFLGAVASVGEGDEQRPAHLGDVYGQVHADSFLEVLATEVDPGWAQRVQDYRERRVTLEDMWTGLARSAWETFVSLAHAQAVADASDDEHFNEVLLANEAYGLYIRPVWRAIMDVLDRYAVLCTTEETVVMDAEVMSAGIEALMGMWMRLGLTFEATGPGETYIRVDEPERPSPRPRTA